MVAEAIGIDTSSVEDDPDDPQQGYKGELMKEIKEEMEWEKRSTWRRLWTYFTHDDLVDLCNRISDDEAVR